MLSQMPASSRRRRPTPWTNGTGSPWMIWPAKHTPPRHTPCVAHPFALLPILLINHTIDHLLLHTLASPLVPTQVVQPGARPIWEGRNTGRGAWGHGGMKVWGHEGMGAWCHGGMNAWGHGGLKAWGHGARGA